LRKIEVCSLKGPHEIIYPVPNNKWISSPEQEFSVFPQISTDVIGHAIKVERNIQRDKNALWAPPRERVKPGLQVLVGELPSRLQLAIHGRHACDSHRYRCVDPVLCVTSVEDKRTQGEQEGEVEGERKSFTGGNHSQKGIIHRRA
jgi:hypothetical protein